MVLRRAARRAGEKIANAVVLGKVVGDRLDFSRAQPQGGLARHPGRVGPEFRRVDRLDLVPPGAQQDDVTLAHMAARLVHHVFGDRGVGADPADVHHRGLAGHHVEADAVGGEAARREMPWRIHVGEAMREPSRPGRLDTVAGLVALVPAALDRPAEVVGHDRGREVDDVGHGGFPWLGSGRVGEIGEREGQRWALSEEPGLWRQASLSSRGG